MVNIEEIKKSIKIENVVVSTTAEEKLDLERVVVILGKAEYNKKRFPGIVYRAESPKVAVLIFGSGKMVCTGARSAEDARVGLSNVFEKLQEGGMGSIKYSDTKTHNIVATANLGRALNLNSVSIGLGLENVEYEPEQFPGLVYRIREQRVVVLMFSSGKLVITGAKRPEDTDAAMEKIVEELDGLGML